MRLFGIRYCGTRRRIQNHAGTVLLSEFNGCLHRVESGLELKKNDRGSLECGSTMADVVAGQALIGAGRNDD